LGGRASSSRQRGKPEERELVTSSFIKSWAAAHSAATVSDVKRG